MKYTGGCHCDGVKYEVEADLSHTITCNCTYCQKKGFILAFVKAKQFTLLSGEDLLTEYRFNTKAIAHLFCKVCGAQSSGRGAGKDGKLTVMLNVRCLDNVDLTTLHPSEFDGKSM